MKVHIIHAKDLHIADFYSVLRLRNEVFIVEQNCVYQDLDGKDMDCFHAMVVEDKRIIGTCRIVPPGLGYKDAVSFGRFAIHGEFRNGKRGFNLMQAVMHFLKKEFAGKKLRISAQEHLVDFYRQHGLVANDKKYLEDGIPHVEMEMNID